MQRQPSIVAKLVATAAFAFAFGAEAQVIRVDESAFTPAAGLITFSEFAGGTVNPTYTAADYGGGAGAPTVTFAGYFTGQSLGTAATCPAGAALTGCVVGTPTGSTLTLDAASPSTSIVSDTSNPTSPVLSGSPTFNGAISILFSTDQYGVGLQGGFFDAPQSTAITAFDRQGNVIGLVSNNSTGIEFLGLVTADGSAKIAGLQFDLVGDEPFGFAIDNVRFGKVGEVVVVPTVPEPETYALMLAGLGILGFMARRRKS
jgi:PEP-CTERM motif